MAKKKIKRYEHAAGGWGALSSTARHLVKSENVAKNIRNLLKTNQTVGFDCPGCAWGDEQENAYFKFCENGAKAVNWEATSKRVSRAFLNEHPVSWLKKQDGYFLEYQGRLSEPLSYNSNTDCYEPITWDEAFKLIAEELNALDSPDQAEFYTSGRASNEAAFMYQLFVRKFGTNNFPDCSNMCHEASGVALNQSIGIGKGTVTLSDFEKADAIFIFGQNPATNHPRMMDTLYKASKRGASIVSFNTLKERGLERFSNPQNKLEMIQRGSTPISSLYLTPKLGGDMAAVRGMVKHMLELHRESISQKQEGVFDRHFLEEHCSDVDAYLNVVEQTSWEKIEIQSGLSKSQLQHAAKLHLEAKNVICTWAMGITQHKHSVQTIQEIANLQLLRGQIGKAGAGLCPVRGHSNVQGDRTMGIHEAPSKAFLESIENTFGFTPPSHNGHNVVQAIQAMKNNQSKVFIGLGGNFSAATPDTKETEQALQNCNLTVHIATKLNRSHLITGKRALILPCLGRTDIDIQKSGPQKVTVEDSFSMVHASSGVVKSDTGDMKSEIAIIGGIAKATLGQSPVDWDELVADYNKIRDLIEKTIPGFDNFNRHIQKPGGFYLGNSAAKLIWNTTNGKARFFSHTLPSSVIPSIIEEKNDNNTRPDLLVLQTLRTHDQYNTTVYGMDDRYRGVYGQRKVLFMNKEDIDALGLKEFDQVDMLSHWHDGIERRVSGFSVVEYDIPKGNAAAYYPETNPLVPLDSYGDLSWTPTSKSIAIEVIASNSNHLLKVTGG
ncbi:FdhF/YdeP family oxidoreductase [Vibrio sp. S4M6]|uniref:FdhF/YdeP family oxidoreductase n=1 Tax=Vibrio sinus TaxID=2946865 RepID=UPI00202A098A|nr:FdhF/YdeP family oxidoreductase [Vibrio sinus]MCL9783312.1 FdhF/YdeP family oxidoreductase [Vibrio sinus]